MTSRGYLIRREKMFWKRRREMFELLTRVFELEAKNDALSTEVKLLREEMRIIAEEREKDINR